MLNFFKYLFGKKVTDDVPQISEQVYLSEKEIKVDEEMVEQAEMEAIVDDLKLEIKTVEKKKEIEYSSLPPYDPFMALSKYQFPLKSLMLGESIQINENMEDKLPVFWAIENDYYKVKDLSELKAMMVVGTQSTGKTTLLHQIIASLLVNNHPAQLKLILADIKGIEFNIYQLLDKHFIAKLPLNNSIISDAEALKLSLNALCIELDNRYDLFKIANERNVTDYNKKFIERKLDPKIGHQHLPYIILIVDDLDRFTLYNKDEILRSLERIVNEGYKVGIISVIATSQFGGHTASGSLLSLIGQRVAFNLFSKDEYKRIFETVRLERHLEPGEFLYNEGRLIVKAKTILSDFSIVEKIVQSISNQDGFSTAYYLPEYRNIDEVANVDLSDLDPLFEEAARLIVQNQIGSTSLLQRRMKLGYNRAGRLMDQLEAAGVVGPNQESKAREVLIKTEAELIEYLQNLLS